MSVNLNCNQGNVIKPNFKGSYQKTENGTPYYKTNSGTIAGGVMAVPAALAWIGHLAENSTNEVKTPFDKYLAKNSPEYNSILKKRAIPCAIAAAGLTLGCGVLVDYLRNKKAQESAEFVKQVGTKKAIMEGDNLALSNKGRAYYESNQGKKYGLGLGALCGIIHYAMGASKHNTNGGIGVLLISAIEWGLGGLLMGAIADHNTNNDARKHA